MAQKSENSKLSLLERQVERNALPHAYLFSGSDEKAKNDSIEFILINTLGENWRRSADFTEISDNPITIDAIRTMKSRAYLAPLTSSKNVFIIRNIENLSKDAAPALLKMLEDTPKSVLILATTLNQKILLPTIQSRFSILRFYQKSPQISDTAFRQLESIEKKARQFPDFLNLKCFEEALWARSALTNPTINKRLINEYLTMLTL